MQVIAKMQGTTLEAGTPQTLRRGQRIAQLHILQQSIQPNVPKGGRVESDYISIATGAPYGPPYPASSRDLSAAHQARAMLTTPPRRLGGGAAADLLSLLSLPPPPRAIISLQRRAQEVSYRTESAGECHHRRGGVKRGRDSMMVCASPHHHIPAGQGLRRVCV